MKGDKHKPKPTFYRWMDATMDGLYSVLRIPSETDGKRYTRRWRRRKEKKETEEIGSE